MARDPLTEKPYSNKTDEEYRNAISKSKGNISAIAILLGISRTSVDSKIGKNLELKQLLNQVREQRNDEAEQLIKNVMDDTSEDIKIRIEAAKFWLSHMARNRGWGDVVTNINLNANIVETDFDTTVYSTDEKRELLEKLSKGMKKEDSEDEIIDGEFTDRESSSNNS